MLRMKAQWVLVKLCSAKVLGVNEFAAVMYVQWLLCILMMNDFHLIFWYHLILLMVFTGLMFHWSAVVHVQHCFTICSSAVFFLHLCVCVCVHGCVCVLSLRVRTRAEKDKFEANKKNALKETARRTYGMHSALPVSGSRTQQNTRSNLIWLAVKQRNLRGPFETISRQSLQTIFLH